MEKISQLFHYHVWATDKLLAYIEKEVPDTFSVQIESVFPSIRETFQHQYEVDCLWYGRMNNSYQNDLEKPSSPGDYRLAFQSLHQAMNRFIAESRDLTSMVSYRTSEGEEFKNRVEDLLQHLVNHGTYHRGNIGAMLRQQGSPGCSTDYIYFLREMNQ
ncbi:DinB family protein [Bacillus sp. SCS-153A]|uniref:DinB family protein n=1 Tax=Rossellomorea sedimentorum TaxID=3115294 RepID=UPI0039058BB7